MALLRKVKRARDPDDLMNPRVLLPTEPPRAAPAAASASPRPIR